MVPYLMGSALKGLARSFARRLEGWAEELTKTAFGATDEAGYVTFYDALYVPGSGYNRGQGAQALHRDVLTVHHQKYYQGKSAAPADWDEPNPVPFLSATGRYLVALSGPTDWVNATFQILEIALREEGIGAKTSSGYGRMTLD